MRLSCYLIERLNQSRFFSHEGKHYGETVEAGNPFDRSLALTTDPDGRQ